MWPSLVKAHSLRYAGTERTKELMSKEQVGRTCFAFAACILVYNTKLLDDVFKQTEDVITYVNTIMDKNTKDCPMPSQKLDAAYIRSKDEYSRSRVMCSLFGDTNCNEIGGSAYHVFTAFLNVANVPWKRNELNNFGYVTYKKEKDEDGKNVDTEIKYQLFQDTFDNMEKGNAKVLLIQSRLLDDQLSEQEKTTLQEEKALGNERYRVTRYRMLNRSSASGRNALNDTLKRERNHMLRQRWDLRGVFLNEHVTHTETKYDSQSSRPRWKLQDIATSGHVLALVRDPNGEDWFTCDSSATKGCINLNDTDEFFVEKIHDNIRTKASTETDGFVAIVVKSQ